MSANQEGIPGWLKGCALGCGAVGLLIVLAVVGAGWYAYRTLPGWVQQQRTEVASQVRKVQEENRDNAAITPEQRALLDELTALSEDPQIPAPMALMAAGQVIGSLGDKSISDREFNDLTEIVKLVRESRGKDTISAIQDLQEKAGGEAIEQPEKGEGDIRVEGEVAAVQ